MVCNDLSSFPIVLGYENGIPVRLQESTVLNLASVSSNLIFSGGVPLSDLLTPVTGGTSSFILLTDTPASYFGEGGKFVRVNVAATGLEFVEVSLSGYNTDVEITSTPTDKASLIWSGTGSKWVASSLGISDMSDASSTFVPSNGDALVWNGSKWIPSSLNIPTSIGDLDDVAISIVSVGDVLAWDGNDWVPSSGAFDP